MPTTVSFDECFQTFPKLDPPSDLEAFWKEEIQSLKRFQLKNLIKRF